MAKLCINVGKSLFDSRFIIHFCWMITGTLRWPMLSYFWWCLLVKYVSYSVGAWMLAEICCMHVKWISRCWPVSWSEACSGRDYASISVFNHYSVVGWLMTQCLCHWLTTLWVSGEVVRFGDGFYWWVCWLIVKKYAVHVIHKLRNRWHYLLEHRWNLWGMHC